MSNGTAVCALAPNLAKALALSTRIWTSGSVRIVVNVGTTTSGLECIAPSAVIANNRTVWAFWFVLLARESKAGIAGEAEGPMRAKHVETFTNTLSFLFRA